MEFEKFNLLTQNCEEQLPTKVDEIVSMKFHTIWVGEKKNLFHKLTVKKFMEVDQLCSNSLFYKSNMNYRLYSNRVEIIQETANCM